MDKRELAKSFAVFGAGAFAVLGGIGALSLVDTFRSPLGAVSSPESPIAANSTETSSQSGVGADQVSGDSEETQGNFSSTDASQNNSTSGAEEPIAEPQASPANPGLTTDIANLRNNTFVTLTGEVTRVSEEDEFILTDPTGSVQIFTGESFFTVTQGEIVTVTGLVDRSIILEVYAKEIQHQDGTITTIKHYG